MTQESPNYGRFALAIFIAVLTLAVFNWPSSPEDQAREAAEAKKRDSKANAQAVCIDTVRSQAKFGSKASFGWSRDARFVGGADDKWMVSGTVDLMNGFGALIPHRYVCNVINGKVERTIIQPGS